MFVNKNSWNNIRQGHVDRFVLSRDSLDEVRTRSRLYQLEKQPTDCLNIWSVNYLKERKTVSYFKHAFGLDHKRFDYSPRDASQMPVWPCRPRKRSYLSYADSVFDLPNYKYSHFPELVDWSRHDVLVAALNCKYYNWSWKTQTLVGVGISKQDICCCKYNPNGNLLVLGQQNGIIEIHDSNTNKRIETTYCRCHTTCVMGLCTIGSIDWNPKGDTFVVGCSNGRMMTFLVSGICIAYRKISSQTINAVRCSPDGRHVAALSKFDAKIYTYPGLIPIMSVCSPWIVKCLAWHPWCSELLAVGFMNFESRTALGLYDLTKLKKTCTELPQNKTVGNILFSKRTGEMVLSLGHSENGRDPAEENEIKIIVLKDFVTIVDALSKRNIIGIKQMLFSPDGSKLATATIGEDLIINNFLPEDNSNDPKNRGLNKPMIYNIR